MCGGSSVQNRSFATLRWNEAGGAASRLVELANGQGTRTLRRPKEKGPKSNIIEPIRRPLGVAMSRPHRLKVLSTAREMAAAPLQNMLPSIIRSDLRILAQMSLTVMTTEDGVGFITSDNPCIWFDPERRRPLLQSRTIEVILPVSPHNLAVLCWREGRDYWAAGAEELTNANRLQQRHAEDYLIVRRNIFQPTWIE